MRYRLAKRKALHGQFAGPPPVRGGGLEQTRGRIMVSQQLRLGVSALGPALFERLRDLAVDRHPLALQQRVVGGVLHEGMLERIHRLRDLASTRSQLGGNEAREDVDKCCLAHHLDLGEQFVTELASDDCTDLRDSLDRRDAVQARHQRVAQRLRDRNAEERAGIDVAIPLIDQVAGLDDRLGQLLHEERDTVRLGDDLLDKVIRKRFPGGQVRYELLALCRRQPCEVESRYVRISEPRRFKFRSVSEHRQQGNRRPAVQ